MGRKGKPRNSKLRKAERLANTQAAQVPIPDYWDFFASPASVPKCRFQHLEDHVVNECVDCLNQRLAYEALTGGTTAKTWLTRAMALGERFTATKDPSYLCPAEQHCAAADERDPNNPIILCIWSTYIALHGPDKNCQQPVRGPATPLVPDKAHLEHIEHTCIRAIELERSELISHYNLAVVADIFATRNVKNSTRDKKKSREYAMKTYERFLACDGWDNPVSLEVIRKRYQVLEKYRPGQKIALPVFGILPMSYVDAHFYDATNPGVKTEKLVLPSPSKPAEGYKDAANILADLLKEEKARKAKKRVAVELKLIGLLKHLQGASISGITTQNVKDKLLEHFMQVRALEGCADNEMRKALRYFGEEETLVAADALPKSTKKRSRKARQKGDLPELTPRTAPTFDPDELD